jgi:hypothetical protein
VLQAKIFYLNELANGPKNHRNIMKRLAPKFNVSATVIRDTLVAEGLIVLVKKVMQSNGKNAYFYKLTGKELVASEQQENSPTWEDGTVKSKGNAFDWRNKEQSFMSKRDIVIAQQKYRNNNPITIYSRA